jgi:hypothetical protein
MIAWFDSLRLLFCARLQNTATPQARYPSAIFAAHAGAVSVIAAATSSVDPRN